MGPLRGGTVTQTCPHGIREGCGFCSRPRTTTQVGLGAEGTDGVVVESLDDATPVERPVTGPLIRAAVQYDVVDLLVDLSGRIRSIAETIDGVARGVARGAEQWDTRTWRALEAEVRVRLRRLHERLDKIDKVPRADRGDPSPG